MDTPLGSVPVVSPLNLNIGFGVSIEAVRNRLLTYIIADNVRVMSMISVSHVREIEPRTDSVD